MRMIRGKTGFTLVELLVVIAIIGILVALLLPAVQAAREAARRSECNNKVKQMVLASHNYQDTRRQLPPACERGRMTHNFLFAILPFIEQGTVYDAAFNVPNNGHSWDQPLPGTPSGTIRSAVMSIYNCPSDYTLSNGYPMNQVNVWGGTSYAANFLIVGMADKAGDPWQGGTSRMARYKIETIPDGSSNTVLIAERLATCRDRGNLWSWPGGDWNANEWGVTFANIHWGGNWNQTPMIAPKPWNSVCDPTRPSTAHSTVCIVGLADGSVRGVSANVSQPTWLMAITPDDGMPLPDEWN
jgi:prepilin-type N-terminal cleavage/methylation domain-containing protein